MKTEDSSEASERLTELLGEWKMEQALPGRFKSDVWERIRLEEPVWPRSVWSILCQWLDSRLARPSWAVSYIALLLLIGLLGGYWRASERIAQTEHHLRIRYVQAVDPYRAPRN